MNFFADYDKGTHVLRIFYAGYDKGINFQDLVNPFSKTIVVSLAKIFANIQISTLLLYTMLII